MIWILNNLVNYKNNFPNVCHLGHFYILLLQIKSMST